jgi:adenylosuccinate lyase
MEVWQGNGAFLNLLKGEKEIADYLANDELEALFDLGYHTKHVETIFSRVLEDG